MRRNLADQGLPVALGHPILRLDLVLRVHTRLEARLVGAARCRDRLLLGCIKALGIHLALLSPVSRKSDTQKYSIQCFPCHIEGWIYCYARPMKNRLSDTAATLVTRFRRQRPLRGGSLLVTIFGDAIAPRGGAVTLASLIDLAAPFGLNERLVRTSMARLAADGWLQNRRRGRLSE